MKRILSILALSAALSACLSGCGEAPSEESPVTPEVVCEDSTGVNAVASECNTAEGEVAESMPEAAEGN
jgi:hypothetical protein